MHSRARARPVHKPQHKVLLIHTPQYLFSEESFRQVFEGGWARLHHHFHTLHNGLHSGKSVPYTVSDTVPTSKSVIFGIVRGTPLSNAIRLSRVWLFHDRKHLQVPSWGVSHAVSFLILCQAIFPITTKQIITNSSTGTVRAKRSSSATGSGVLRVHVGCMSHLRLLLTANRKGALQNASHPPLSFFSLMESQREFHTLK